MGKLGLVLLVVFLSASCVEDEPFDCQLGQLTGTWRLEFRELDGSCGAIAATTIVFNPNEPVAENCTVHSQTTSADLCRSDTDLTCVGDGFEERWTGVLEHVAADVLSGTVTISYAEEFQSCRSTYDVTYRRL